MIIVQVSITSPGAHSASDPVRAVSSRIVQPSHSPAKANSPPSFGLNSHGCFSASRQVRSYKPSAGIRHRRARQAARKEGLALAISARALIRLYPMFGSLAQDGIRPQRSIEIRLPSSPAWAAAISCPVPRHELLFDIEQALRKARKL